MQSDHDALVSTAEAAKLAGVTVATICRWAKEGTLIPATRLPGGRMTFRRSTIQALITVETDPVEALLTPQPPETAPVEAAS